MTFVTSEPYIGHLGLGVESMVTAMVPNIRNELAGKEPSDIPKERGFNNFRKSYAKFPELIKSSLLT